MILEPVSGTNEEVTNKNAMTVCDLFKNDETISDGIADFWGVCWQ